LVTAAPAQAFPYDHWCSGRHDSNCRVGLFRRCDFYDDTSDMDGKRYCTKILTIMNGAGSGDVSPGLTTAATNVTYTVNLNVTLPYGDEVITTACTYKATSIVAESVIAGSGHGTFSCAAGMSGNLAYTRQAGVMSLTGSLDHDGMTYPIRQSTLDLIYTSANPVTSFVAVGEIALDGYVTEV
jgi:hypothetical protein